VAELELPLRICERDGGLLIRCGCGAELASVAGLRLAQDFSPAGLLRMIMHARKCTSGKETRFNHA